MALVEPSRDTAQDGAGHHMRRDGDDFIFTWPSHKIGIRLSRIRETPAGVSAELTIESQAVGPIHWGALNLAATWQRDQLVSKLRKEFPGPPWPAMIERVCRESAAALRKGAPVVLLRPAAPSAARELVEKFLPLGETAVLHGDGGSGKSYLGLAVAVSVATGTPLPQGLRPLQRAPVLYLDYESCLEEHQERLYALLQGFEITQAEGIFYRPMFRPLADDLAILKAEIGRHGIGLVIVDSFAPACGPEPEGADAAIRTMNALRALTPATRLVIAHVSKATAEQRRGASRPFGSVFVRNLARSEWEVRASEDDREDGTLSLGLFHRKANRGRLHRPIGLRLEFTNDSVRLRAHDVADHADLAARTSVSSRILHALRDGPREVNDLAEDADTSPGSVRKTLQRLEGGGRVIRLGQATPGKAGRWALLSSRDSVT